ncbi:MAG: phosphatidylserine/phosphatidylglycerophosphate/cardiolipin synthase-like enzyme [Myxococcota bacterium]|jgi:phosphatidylserine/phosphatidylglycerophosphate/cardiolipin synthase-like enzyme
MRLAVLVLLAAACARLPEGERTSASEGGAGPAIVTPPDASTLDSEMAFDRDFLPAALEAIAAAEDHIRLAQFLVSDDAPVDGLLDALAVAVHRGVRVQVLADEEGDYTARVLRNLELDGIETQLDDPRVMTHNKLVLADDITIVGSHNLTSSALGRNHEGSVRLADADVTAWYAAWFDAMWDVPEVNPVQPEWSRGDIVPLADRDITPAVLDCIDTAAQSVDIVMYCWLWDDRYPGSDVDLLLMAVEAAHARGVSVRVLLDDSDWVRTNQINDAAVARLEAAGIDVWRSPNDVTMHAKVLRCDDRVLISDANWTYSGLELVHGTSAMVSDPELVAQAEAWMAELRDEGRRR